MNFYSIAQFIKSHYPAYYSIETYPKEHCIAIRKTSEEWGILSNFARTPISVDGVVFGSAEQLFQLMKFTDTNIISRIWGNTTRSSKKCYQIKKTVRSYEKEHRREDWGTIIVDAMKFCLQQKYNQCADFKTALLASNGRFIVEDQTSMPKKQPDTWGVKLTGDHFVGPNLLGRLLMELRDNGKLEYTLPKDALYCIYAIKQK